MNLTWQYLLRHLRHAQLRHAQPRRIVAQRSADALCAVQRIADRQIDWPAMGAASRRKAEYHAHTNVIARYAR